MIKNIGFVSTRFAGLDGVSLEAGKWADVLQSNGHNCFWFAGELDRDPDKSHLVYEAHFKHPYNQWINRQIYGTSTTPASVMQSIDNLKKILKARLRDFIDLFHIHLLIIENALAIPLHIPLGLALAELVSETQIPTIAHHHDFFWERDPLQKNAIEDYLHNYFPPNLSNIEHVVINTMAQDELQNRRGIASALIPNVLDFDNPSPSNSRGYETFLRSFGLKPGCKFILQPTRIIERKGIEHAVDLVKSLRNAPNKLLISHEAGDEGWKYARWIKNYALERGVDLHFPRETIVSPWHHAAQHLNGHCLWNIYAHADFVTFPSRYEGFGNALLEAIYFKKPLLVNRYATFRSDIEPKGFNLVTMDGKLTAETIQAIQDILESPEKKAEMVSHNYEVARQHFSYDTLRSGLETIMDHMPVGVSKSQKEGNDWKWPDSNASKIRPQTVQFAHLKN